jgi:LacI family transcriptional regulator
MASVQSCSLLRVARAAGVAASTASLALRGSALVKPDTAARVKAAAERLGYRADPRVGSLMARIRRARPTRDREKLAFVWVSVSKAETRHHPFCQRSLGGAVRRAAELGWGVDEFWLGEDGMSAARLEGVLSARGIVGVVFSAPMRDVKVTVDWDWSRFAAAAIGNSDWTPPLHRAAHHHYRSTWRAMDWLVEAGARHPAIILHEPHHLRLHGAHQAAFLANHPRPALAHRACRFGYPDAPSELEAWLCRVRADSLVCVIRPAARLIAEARAVCGDRIVTLESPDANLPGVELCEEEIAAQAVDLTVAQLHRNERGAPAFPATVLFEGRWRDAKSAG